MTSDKCPKCGANMSIIPPDGYYLCGTVVGDDVSQNTEGVQCLRNQLAQAQAKLEAAEIVTERLSCENCALDLSNSDEPAIITCEDCAHLYADVFKENAALRETLAQIKEMCDCEAEMGGGFILLDDVRDAILAQPEKEES